MKILIVTHIFLLIFLFPSRISPDVKSLLKNPSNDIFLFAASVWEMAIKYGNGKLQISDRPENFIPDRMDRATFKRLEITHRHASAVTNLPPIHKDPFDRLLIAQAKAENLTLLSADKISAQYRIIFIDSDTYKI